MTLFLSLGLDIIVGSLICTALMAAAMMMARTRLLLRVSAEEGPLFVRPKGIVLLLSLLVMVTFLAEGAMLDWSALLVTQLGLLDVRQRGIGYILFAIAMTIGQLVGDRLVARLGDFCLLFGGGLVVMTGFAIILTVPVIPVALTGFLLVGFGASNIVPVLFRRAGNQADMPPALAIGAPTTLGYAGILVGPAGIGFLAKALNLTAAF